MEHKRRFKMKNTKGVMIVSYEKGNGNFMVNTIQIESFKDALLKFFHSSEVTAYEVFEVIIYNEGSRTIYTKKEMMDEYQRKGGKK